MNNQSPNKSIKDQISEKITGGDVHMRSKSYFVIRTSLLILGIIIATGTALFLVSLFLFQIQGPPAQVLPKFGFRGLKILFLNLPWLIILAAILFIVLLEIFVERFKFAYRKPLLYSVLGVIVFVFMAGLALNKTPIHRNLAIRSDEGHLSFAKHLYQRQGWEKIDNLFIGKVNQITDKGFIILIEDEEIEVIVNEKTKMPPNLKIKEDDRISLIGEKIDDAITAFGIKIIDKELDDFPLPRIKGRKFSPPPRSMK
ncbi:MAG: hypothetical protein Q8P83_00270 [bacterium]|nr:hypothetical protein [bacterium]